MKKEKSVPLVKIEIKHGIANVVHKDYGFEVLIIDYDTEGFDNRNFTEIWGIDETIKQGEI